MTSLAENVGVPPYLPFTIFVCESVFIGVFICGCTSCLFLPASFTSFAFFTGRGDRLAWCNCPRWVAEAGGLGGDAANRDEAPAGWGRSSAPSSVRYNALGDALPVQEP